MSRIFPNCCSPLLSTFLLAAAVAVVSGKIQAQTAYSGDYNYDGGAYVPTDTVINGTLETVGAVGNTIEAAQGFINNAGSFGVWRGSEYGGAVVSAGLGLQMRGPFSSGSGLYRSNGGARINARLGPFFLDDISVGVGAIYSDLQGTPIYGGGTPNASDDNWAAIVWASARFTTYVTDRFALTLTPFVYYLPLKGKVGWGVASPLGSLFGGQVGPASLMQMAYRIPIEGGFELSFWDEFRMSLPSNSLLSDSPEFSANFSDTTPIDYAGRYSFGYGGARDIDANGRGDFRVNDDLFDTERYYFTNAAGVNLRGNLGPSLHTMAYYNRFDVWDQDFNSHTAWNTAGALIVHEGPVFSPYALYEVSATDDNDSVYHMAVVGVNAKLRPDLLAYAQAGWLWAEANGQEDMDSWVAQVGFRQRLGQSTFHGFDAGRAPSGSFGTRYLTDFARYYLEQQIGPRARARLFAEQADLRSLGGASQSDRSATTVGLLAEFALSPRSALGLTASYENVDYVDIKRGYELWTYRAYYSRRFGQTVQGQVFYQYQEAGSGVSALDHFKEHLLFVGLMKQF